MSDKKHRVTTTTTTKDISSATCSNDHTIPTTTTTTCGVTQSTTENEKYKNGKYVINVNGGDGRDNINVNINENPERKIRKRKISMPPVKVKSGGFFGFFINGFFGWVNIKWVMREFLKIYSPEPSFFSKKRFESSIAFIIAQIGMVIYFYYNYKLMEMSDFILWVGIEFAVSGYYVTQIQREKKYYGGDYGSYYGGEYGSHTNDYDNYDNYEDPNSRNNPNNRNGDNYRDPNYEDPNSRNNPNSDDGFYGNRR